MSLIKTPFSDQVGLDTVPHKGTEGGDYGTTEYPGAPAGDSHYLPELSRDTAVTSKSPSVDGMYKTPFKDAV